MKKLLNFQTVKLSNKFTNLKLSIQKSRTFLIKNIIRQKKKTNKFLQLMPKNYSYLQVAAPLNYLIR